MDEFDTNVGNIVLNDLQNPPRFQEEIVVAEHPTNFSIDPDIVHNVLDHVLHSYCNISIFKFDGSETLKFESKFHPTQYSLVRIFDDSFPTTPTFSLVIENLNTPSVMNRASDVEYSMEYEVKIQSHCNRIVDNPFFLPTDDPNDDNVGNEDLSPNVRLKVFYSSSSVLNNGWTYEVESMGYLLDSFKYEVANFISKLDTQNVIRWAPCRGVLKCHELDEFKSYQVLEQARLKARFMKASNFDSSQNYSPTVGVSKKKGTHGTPCSNDVHGLPSLSRYSSLTSNDNNTRNSSLFRSANCSLMILANPKNSTVLKVRENMICKECFEATETLYGLHFVKRLAVHDLYQIDRNNAKDELDDHKDSDEHTKHIPNIKQECDESATTIECVNDVTDPETEDHALLSDLCELYKQYHDGLCANVVLNKNELLNIDATYSDVVGTVNESVNLNVSDEESEDQKHFLSNDVVQVTTETDTRTNYSKMFERKLKQQVEAELKRKSSQSTQSPSSRSLHTSNKKNKRGAAVDSCTTGGQYVSQRSNLINLIQSGVIDIRPAGTAVDPSPSIKRRELKTSPRLRSRMTALKNSSTKVHVSPTGDGVSPLRRTKRHPKPYPHVLENSLDEHEDALDTNDEVINDNVNSDPSCEEEGVLMDHSVVNLDICEDDFGEDKKFSKLYLANMKAGLLRDGGPGSGRGRPHKPSKVYNLLPSSSSSANRPIKLHTTLKSSSRKSILEKIPILTCDICLFETRKKYVFERHMQSHQDKFVINEPITCPFCKEELADKTKLNPHYRECHDGGSVIEEPSVGRESVNPQERRVEQPYGLCIICFELVERCNLKKHLDYTHFTNVPNKVCKDCGKTFKQQRDLQIHRSIYHDGTAEPAVCDVCGKVLPHQKMLAKHHQTVHVYNIRGPVKCPFCEKIFDKSMAWHKHVKLHSKVKPFRCAWCEYRSVNRFNILWHMKKRHSSTAEYSDIVKDGEFVYDIPKEELEITKHFVKTD